MPSDESLFGDVAGLIDGARGLVAGRPATCGDQSDDTAKVSSILDTTA